jgi:CxxC motif-containing protein (DUF1111 family)
VPKRHADGAGDCTKRSRASAPNGNSRQFENLEANFEVTDLVVFCAKNRAVPACRNHDDA